MEKYYQFRGNLAKRFASGAIRHETDADAGLPLTTFFSSPRFQRGMLDG
jgi:hypothetical protein